jgi:hypothetical protein
MELRADRLRPRLIGKRRQPIENLCRRTKPAEVRSRRRSDKLSMAAAAIVDANLVPLAYGARVGTDAEEFRTDLLD